MRKTPLNSLLVILLSLGSIATPLAYDPVLAERCPPTTKKGWLAESSYRQLDKLTVERIAYEPSSTHPVAVRLHLHNTHSAPIKGWLHYKLQNIVGRGTVEMWALSELFIDLDSGESVVIYETCEDEFRVRGTYTLELIDPSRPDSSKNVSAVQTTTFTKVLPETCDTVWNTVFNRAA